MSPTAVDKLTKGSSDAQTKAAVSECIATEVRAGTPQEQAIAMCHEMARRKGAPVVPKGGS